MPAAATDLANVVTEVIHKDAGDDAGHVLAEEGEAAVEGEVGAEVHALL